MVCLAGAAALLLACAPGAPRERVGKSFFMGTWHSDYQCLENFKFADTSAEWQVNYRTCISDTIKDPFQFVDSIVYDTVRDSFLIMDFRGWEASDSEIVFYDTFKMPGGAVATSSSTLPITIWSHFQFYVDSAPNRPRTLYTKQ
jgi:hypothetical protein